MVYSNQVFALKASGAGSIPAPLSNPLNGWLAQLVEHIKNHSVNKRMYSATQTAF